LFLADIQAKSCKPVYLELAFEAGANHKEAQQLARHSTPELTANIYGRTRNERLIEITDRVTDMVLFGEVGVNKVHKTKQDVTAANDKSLQTKAVTPQYGEWRRGDSNPRPVTFQGGRLHV